MITFDLKTLPYLETLVTGKYILQMVSIANNYIDSNKSESIEFAHIDLSPYNVLPYLVATDASKAWIDTGIPYQNGCKIEMKTTLYNFANLFGVFYTTQRCRGYWEGTTGTAVFNIGTSRSDAVFPKIAGYNRDDTVIWNCTANPDTKEISLVIGDESDIRTASQSSTIAYDTSPYTIYLFTVHRTADITQNGTRIIHYFKYWDVDSNLLLDLIPVERKSDGVLGMLNKVNGQFLTNISTGTFYKEIPM